ncbi:HAMP domain-containing sensor histidine kinase [uncultured Methylibium sp.]|uniref:sensor histidine kinase n=1 Tax=uncultured Methylibium sp. TaxID=381093 RepID=UPI0025CEFE38|nr:HAMP domain-containing sensor histidine kinase [uncultured Methylibium sp.]
MQRDQAIDEPAETAGSSRLGTLSGRSLLLVALALIAVLVAAGFWLIATVPTNRSPALAVLAVSGIVLVASLSIGLHLQRRAQASKREAAALQARARAEAQRSAQARTALLGMVSHELRTPLQTMLANVELLALKPQNPATAQLVQGLEQCIVQIKGRLDNIAQYARLASGNVELRREPFRLVPLLERVVTEHAEAAQANDQTLKLDAPQTADVQVHGDDIRLHQVLNNYLSNAVKYSGPGVIDIRAKLLSHTFGTMSLAEGVEVSVTDHGPGIPEAVREAVWEPFVRGAARSNRPKGSGLGLAVVKLLATTAAWDVGMRSDAEGTTFFVVLPLSGPAASPISASGKGG